MHAMRRPLRTLASRGWGAPLAALVLSGCGLSVASADLFVLHRRGPGGELTALVSDGGTLRCGTATPKPLPDALLLAARDLAEALDKDAKGNLQPQARPGSVYQYTFKLTDGTLAFADTAASTRRPELGPGRAARRPDRRPLRPGLIPGSGLSRGGPCRWTGPASVPRRRSPGA